MKRLAAVVLLVGCTDSPSGHLEATVSQLSNANVDAAPFAGEVTHARSWSDQTKVAIDMGSRRIMLVLPKPLEEKTYQFNGDTFAQVDVLQNVDACDAGREDCMWWSTDSGTMTIERNDGGTVELSFTGNAGAVDEPAL